MAGRIKFQRINRKVHFFASILILVFSLLFIISGFVMTRHDWFPIGEELKNTQTFPLQTKIDTSRLQQIGEYLKEKHKINGRMNFNVQNNGTVRFIFNHPGEKFEVRIPPEQDSIHVTTSIQNNFGGVFRQYHHFHGIRGGSLYVVWGIMLDLTAFSFILFAITGIIMWYKNRKFLTFGWPILIGAFTIALIFILSLLLI